MSKKMQYFAVAENEYLRRHRRINNRPNSPTTTEARLAVADIHQLSSLL